MKYTDIRNTQIVLYLLKAHGIKKVIASPGTQNMSLVVSMQHDSWFEMYSAPDERSAAYMACGLAAESGEPVVLSCTGATASRNYIPGLTEAYYRKLPVVAITSTARLAAVGHNVPQIIDRSAHQKDIVKISVVARAVFDKMDEWDCSVQVNKALLELTHNGGGPVHVNLEKVDGDTFSVSELPKCRVINRYSFNDAFPKIAGKQVAIFVGSHIEWSKCDTQILDDFCCKTGAIVFCDQTSNYQGKYRVQHSLVASQEHYNSSIFDADVLINMGEVSGDYYQLMRLGQHAREVWRVSEDGELKDTFKKLTKVFEMPEREFFKRYVDVSSSIDSVESRLNIAIDEYDRIHGKIPELPFCNIWIASKLHCEIPDNSVLHFGILNSLRAWNFFKVDPSVLAYSNVGGFGIDGGVSTMIGSSLANPQKLHFGVFGDLAFFYDMNSIGNRHVGNNVRILLINNAKGSEFKLYSHPASKLGGEEDEYIAAARHYGNQSNNLVKHYASDLGFLYLSANNKDEFLNQYKQFVSPEISDRPILFEVFTDAQDESRALQQVNSIEHSTESKGKNLIHDIVGDKAYIAMSNLKSKLSK